jgi:transcriptional activator SPT7
MRTLTASQVESSSDLKLLLSTVKDGRVSRAYRLKFIYSKTCKQRQGHDPKLSDPFYDSLEGLLVDLRTVTMVSRTTMTSRTPRKLSKMFSWNYRTCGPS